MKIVLLESSGGRQVSKFVYCMVPSSVELEVGEILFHPQSQACGSTWMSMLLEAP